MLLPCTRMAMKTNLNRIKLTTISATARASVRRGRRPTRSLPHQEVTSSEGFLLGPNCTAVIGTHPQYFSFVKAGTAASREYPARSTRAPALPAPMTPATADWKPFCHPDSTLLCPPDQPPGSLGLTRQSVGVQP